MKKTLVWLSVVAAVGTGYHLNEEKWREVVRRQQEEYEAKAAYDAAVIADLKAKNAEYYHPSGAKLSDLAVIDDEPFVNPDEARFAVYRMPELTPELIDSADTLTNRKGEKLVSLSLKDIRLKKQRLAKSVPQDSIECLEINQEYRNLLLAEMFKATRGRHRKNMNLLKKPDDALKRSVATLSNFIQVKLKCRLYPDKDSLNADYYPLLMSADIGLERKLFHRNQAFVDSLSIQNRALHFQRFLEDKEKRKQALIDSAETAKRKISAPLVKNHLKNMKSYQL